MMLDYALFELNEPHTSANMSLIYGGIPPNQSSFNKRDLLSSNGIKMAAVLVSAATFIFLLAYFIRRFRNRGFLCFKQGTISQSDSISTSEDMSYFMDSEPSIHYIAVNPPPYTSCSNTQALLPPSYSDLDLTSTTAHAHCDTEILAEGVANIGLHVTPESSSYQLQNDTAKDDKVMHVLDGCCNNVQDIELGNVGRPTVSSATQTSPGTRTQNL